MSKIKKILSSVLAVVMIACCFVVLTACDKNNDGADDDKNTPKTVEVGTYTQLTEALAGDADVIKFTDDIAVTTQLEVTRKVTIDLNGKTLSNSEDIWDDNENVKTWSIISVRDGGNLTVTGNGKIDAKENDCYDFDVCGGKLTIENGTFVGNVSAVYVHHGEATIKGGSYSIKQLDPKTHDERFTLNLLDENGKNGTAKITVSGGEFKKFDPAHSDSENPEKNYLAEGYKSQLKSGSTEIYEVVAE